MTFRTRLLPAAAFAAGLITTPLFSSTAFAQMAAPSTDQPTATQNINAPVSKAAVTKAGQALRHVLAINKTYTNKLSGTTNPAAKQELVATAKQKAISAISRQGINVATYKEVLALAQHDPAIRQKLLEAAGISAGQAK